jgi:isocitrate/isopropylmalate dehydrogenase
MLEHLGFAAAAGRLTRALEFVYAAGAELTPDQGGSATTERFCEAVAARLVAGERP